MFESALENPSEVARARLVGLFRVATVGQLLNGVLAFIAIGPDPVALADLALSVLCAAATWVTAQGLENGRRWARNAGFMIAFVSLFNLGIGTIFGLIELFSLWRAQAGGLFNSDRRAA